MKKGEKEGEEMEEGRRERERERERISVNQEKQESPLFLQRGSSDLEALFNNIN